MLTQQLSSRLVAAIAPSCQTRHVPCLPSPQRRPGCFSLRSRQHQSGPQSLTQAAHQSQTSQVEEAPAAAAAEPPAQAEPAGEAGAALQPEAAGADEGAVAAEGAEGEQGAEAGAEAQPEARAEGAAAEGAEEGAGSVAPHAEAVAQAQSEETEEVVEERLTMQSAASWLTGTYVGKGVCVSVAAVLLGSLAVAVYRVYQKYNSDRAKRMRQVDRNKGVVEELAKHLPGQRHKLSKGVIGGLRRRTGFTAVEIFRKFLWYLLRERKFDQDAVDDLVALKVAAGLSDADVAEALKERAQRIYDKYGTLMLNTEGMTSEGVERKAACQALFRKLLYLTEYEALIADSAAFQMTDLRKIFGATEDDVAKLRIVSLHEMDAASLDALLKRDAGAEAAAVSHDEGDAGSKPKSKP